MYANEGARRDVRYRRENVQTILISKAIKRIPAYYQTSKIDIETERESCFNFAQFIGFVERQRVGRGCGCRSRCFLMPFLYSLFRVKTIRFCETYIERFKIPFEYFIYVFATKLARTVAHGTRVLMYLSQYSPYSCVKVIYTFITPSRLRLIAYSL